MRTFYISALLALTTALAVMVSLPPVETPKDSYVATWEWCAEKFPYREDLQEACRWGAYEMLPGEDVEVGQDA